MILEDFDLILIWFLEILIYQKNICKTKSAESENFNLDEMKWKEGYIKV